MVKDAKQTAKDLIDVIKADNVISYTNCLTRLQLNIKANATFGINIKI
ncbi:hypothetical protein P344_02175 [Spiroplasma mirum ATCC 29335]|uniref:PTS EIIB type-1 domain-containing protein n=1 Tax=Spiroplasma mirum ATCC 29335 TaxID=838561 RepID=W6AKG5_9MOLU|nr:MULTISPECIES: PTS transporter subunit EIIB [Spiroplasma]AHI57783.1 hypothetical protein P344_02175 [Spiroplasma mirum ATCC 29335]